MCRPTSGQRSVCASASIIDYEIAPDKANERGSAPPLSLSPSPSFSLSITLCRACYSIEFVLVRRVQVRRLTFRLSDDRGARRGEGGTQTRAYTRIHARPLSLSRALRLKHCPLSRHPLGVTQPNRSAVERFTRAQA